VPIPAGAILRDEELKRISSLEEIFYYPMFFQDFRE